MDLRALHKKLLYDEKLTVEDIKNIEWCKGITGLYKKINKQTDYTGCYICKTPIIDGVMCHMCYTYNNKKRNQSPQTSQIGKIAIVTGGRIKIGFYTTLSLLRNGATVIITTRFKDDAIKRYQHELDYQLFRDRLHIVECNFLSFREINNFIKYITDNFESIDYLINNAAQTLSRPDEFYSNLNPLVNN